ncbi:MAG TPA: hypothetical protein PK095_09315, partial [Myxococcota bacterium]|nr:hypothetical protein [Myxococcota bacterium]
VLVRGAFADNLAEGPWEWLFETGAVASLVTFDDGRAHGRQARWSATLELELERYWEHGSPCGLWVDYTTGATRDYGPCDDGLPPPRERPAGFAPTTVAAPWPGTC